MAFDFTPIMLGFLGTAFLLFYASHTITNMFGEESTAQKFMLPLKIFFFMMGIFMIFLTLGTTQKVVDFGINETGHDAEGYPTLDMTGNMSIQTSSGLFAGYILMYGTSLWLIIGMFVMLIMLTIGYAFGKKDSDGGEGE